MGWNHHLASFFWIFQFFGFWNAFYENILSDSVQSRENGFFQTKEGRSAVFFPWLVGEMLENRAIFFFETTLQSSFTS